jgi:hypothetical protein
MTIDAHKEYKDMMLQEYRKHDDYATDLRAQAEREGMAASVKDDLQRLEQIAHEGEQKISRLDGADDRQWQSLKTELDKGLVEMGKVFDRVTSKLA